ncbi:glucosamine-6-phosphate deaminase [Wenxinia marina]|uniref:Glucosamine-6-phosphate deaminase n=1 Tax=Wenxinia marina DSM 24838 TaxID=1123501 RepID=A0A0D0Q5T6_9RHOB|nr:glucosamine-6-phosphate deaminase [Wenxinia marina]KIQ69844.1 glucosamine-6-phosphate isomerase [Wenxinia marina DSM 24838]GGL61662.1 glucosamine-6-phosphate deaminase [Wenxinia marina]
MRIVICDDAAAATRTAVDRIAAALRARPASVLGLATGGTMEPVYEGLIAAHRDGLSFAQAVSFNLDEYVGLPPGHPQSYRSYMQRHLFDHVDIAPERTFVPSGEGDPQAASDAYEAALRAHGPLDLQLLGLGHNGHIGFNEPGSSLASRTREKLLTRTTREANARFFKEGETPPRSAVTMGIGTILEARSILVLALGAGKAAAVQGTVEGPVTAMCPGSALQMHPDVTMIVDSAAAADLSLADFYREAEALRRSREGG